MRSRIFMLFRTMVLVAGIAALVGASATPPAQAAAINEFDVTGTLDCGVESGHPCDFEDWETGPQLALFTEDITGESMRFVVDATWLRDYLTAFHQDDFVWFTVRDGIGPTPVIVSVVEHRCHDGRYPQGQSSHGLSTRDACR